MNKKAFTLFELLIVVSLIGIVYSVFTQKLSINKKIQTLNITNFIPWILEQPFKTNASVICLFDEKDKGCRLYLDDKLQNESRFKFFRKFDDVRVYQVGYEQNFEEKHFFPLEENEMRLDVLFKLDIYANGGFSTTILKKNDIYILYRSYEKSKSFESLHDIKEYMFEEKKLLQER